MADTHPSEASPGMSAPRSQSQYARSTSRTQQPAYDAGGRARARRNDDEGEYGSPTLSNPVDDLVPVLGMLIGGAVGFALATMIPSAQTRSSRSSGWRAFGTGSEGQFTRRAEASGSAEHEETTDLIASSKVEGTAVYNRQGERLGDVYNFMVGKRSPGSVCGHEPWRLPGDWKALSCPALEHADLRHEARRLRDRCGQGAPDGRSPLCRG